MSRVLVLGWQGAQHSALGSQAQGEFSCLQSSCFPAQHLSLHRVGGRELSGLPGSCFPAPYANLYRAGGGELLGRPGSSLLSTPCRLGHGARKQLPRRPDSSPTRCCLNLLEEICSWSAVYFACTGTSKPFIRLNCCTVIVMHV